MSRWTTRHGADFQTPVGMIPGPKAMLINEYAGSGGDALPWYFRQAKIGPLVGKRTWGGLVGIYDYPVLMDGGTVTAPRVAFYNPAGQWDVENHGVDPDLEVDFDPAAWRAGRDPQLEAAVKSVMDQLPPAPAPAPKKPDYPNYHRSPGGSGKPAARAGAPSRWPVDRNPVAGGGVISARNPRRHRGGDRNDPGA